MKMKGLWTILLFLFPAPESTHAQTAERKIMVKGNHFYYTTIDQDFQVATLHRGEVSAPMKTAQHLALPSGRNANHPVNPFCWSVTDSFIYAINSLENAMNDVHEGLKRFRLSDLREWDKNTSAPDMVMKSVKLNSFAPNEPYLFAIRRSNILNNFFFDGIALNDTSYYMAIANNGEMSIWHFNGRTWKHGEVYQFPVSDYFSLFAFKQQVFMLLQTGAVYKIALHAMPEVQRVESPLLSDGILIVNSDNNSIRFLKNSYIDFTVPLNELIEKKAVTLF